MPGGQPPSTGKLVQILGGIAMAGASDKVALRQAEEPAGRAADAETPASDDTGADEDANF